MHFFQLELESPDSTQKPLLLRWQLLEQLPTWHWLRYAIPLVKSKTLTARFTGFISPKKTKADLLKRLENAAKTVNRSKLYRIDDSFADGFSQDFANRMHHHFELLCGSVQKPSPFFLKATPAVKQAIRELNYCVHDLEALDRALLLKKAKQGHDSASAILLEYPSVRRYPLPPELNPYFTLDLEFGDMVLHYSQVGKTWWEVFLDQDKEIFPEAIIPLEFISGEVDLMFAANKPSVEQLKRFKQFLKKQNLDPLDPALKIGYCRIGKFLRDRKFSPQGYKRAIAASLRVRSIKILQDTKILAQAKIRENR